MKNETHGKNAKITAGERALLTLLIEHYNPGHSVWSFEAVRIKRKNGVNFYLIKDLYLSEEKKISKGQKRREQPKSKIFPAVIYAISDHEVLHNILAVMANQEEGGQVPKNSPKSPGKKGRPDFSKTVQTTPGCLRFGISQDTGVGLKWPWSEVWSGVWRDRGSKRGWVRLE